MAEESLGERDMKENIIYSSSQYDDFVFKKENRTIDESFVNKLMKSFEKYGWIGSPIEISETADGKKQIEEGQHRFLAAKKLNIPIRFIVVPERNAYVQAEINDLNNKWKPMKFIEMYARNGVISYKRLLNLFTQFPNYTTKQIFTACGVYGGRQLEIVKEGRLQLSDERFIKTRNVLLDLNTIKEAMDKIGFSSHQYTIGYIQLLKAGAIDKNRMEEKILKYGKSVFEKVATVEKAVDYIERVYNYNSKKDIVYLCDQYKRIKRTQI